MKRLSLVRTALFLLVGTGVTTLGVMACVSDEPAPATPGGSLPEAGTTPTEDGGSNNTGDSSLPIDSGDPDAGEIITDGGDLPPEDEDDGGLTDPDGGFDAGPACGPLTPGAYVTSTCISISRAPAGGDLVSGTYVLDAVTVLGTATFCGAGGGFAAFDHRGVLEVTATSATSATLELLDQYRKANSIVLRPTTVRYDVIANANKSLLTYTPQTCAAKPAPASGAYQTGTLNSGKKYITLRLPYGTKGSANYRFVEP